MFLCFFFPLRPEAHLYLLQARAALTRACRSATLKLSIGGWQDSTVSEVVSVEARLCRQIAELSRNEEKLQSSFAMSKLAQTLEQSCGKVEFATVAVLARAVWAYGQHAAAQKHLHNAIHQLLPYEVEHDDESVCDSLTQMVSLFNLCWRGTWLTT